ncbi:MAG: histidinol dehydrogenase [Arenicella sp.]|nr:histidinol dehydrogenase [Arenicella sp.]
MQINRLDSSHANFNADLAALLKRDQPASNSIERIVTDIITNVRQHGDDAVIRYTLEFDHHQLDEQSIEVPPERLEQALHEISGEQRRSLEFAADRISGYHSRQLQQSWHYDEEDGTQLGQKITPIARVGLYAPGGKAAYPSSVLMNAIPAKVAGVVELVVVSPAAHGQLNNLVLAAAKLAGVDRFLQIGGAQAIAALAYGTESISPVDKITGPGNQYVSAAKKLVFGQVGIDMLAGPSEVLVIADDSVDPDWVAMDLFAQAEHDENAQSILLTRDPVVAENVAQSIARLLPEMERADIIADSLRDNGALIVADSDSALVEIADKIAAEHVELMVQDCDQLAQDISNAGAIFIGPYSSESLGDYAAGPNHVLPTSGTARFSSPLGVYDFRKRSSIIRISEEGAQTIGEHASILARGESLTAHARSAELRLKK